MTEGVFSSALAIATATVRDFRLDFMEPEELYWADEYKRQVLSGDLTNLLDYEAHENMGSYDPEIITERQNRFGFHIHQLRFKDNDP